MYLRRPQMPQDRRLVSAGRGVRVGFAEGDDLSTGYPQKIVTQLSHNCHKKDGLKHLHYVWVLLL